MTTKDFHQYFRACVKQYVEVVCGSDDDKPESKEDVYWREYHEWLEGIRLGRPKEPEVINKPRCKCDWVDVLRHGCKCGGR